MGQQGKSGNQQGKRKKINVSVRYIDEEDDQSWSIGFKVLVALLAVLAGWVNSQHVSSLFENDRHFSHLSNLEREMTFRTEMGMYYSYFKTIVKADALSQGVFKLYRNNVTEYPETINTLKRFNLYPELAIGTLYRILNNGGFLSQQCFQVNRGENLNPVQSCEGLKDPPHFYLAIVWLCAGATVSLIFILGAYISDSLWGGVMGVTCFFFNHSECTRVMWTPPLRESFAFPICLLQVLAVTVTTRNRNPGWKNLFSIGLSTAAFILCWQFAQFMVFTQSAAVFGLYILGVISKETFTSITISQLVGLLHAVAFMFGNEMLFCSWLFSSLVSCLIVSLLLHTPFQLIPNIPRILSQGIVYLVLTVAVKVGLSKALLVEDDAHVFEIFKSKFTDFKNFNTQLYTCAAEFDFLGWEMPWKVSSTLLSPAATLAVILVILHLVRVYRSRTAEEKGESESLNPAVVYTVVQTAGYAVMAVLIMRLKLFFTPHLCLLASLLASRQLVPWLKNKDVHTCVVVGLLAAMSVQGLQNVSDQRKIIGEYSDLNLEEMFEWIIKNTAPNAVFAGTMPTMANLLLSTERAIVNHPHYEDVGARERTKAVYTVFSRREAKEVYDILASMQVNYLVLNEAWCLSTKRGGCAITELWDLEDKVNINRPPVCPILWKNPSPFVKVFHNQEYKIFKVGSSSKRLEIPPASQSS